MCSTKIHRGTPREEARTLSSLPSLSPSSSNDVPSDSLSDGTRTVTDDRIRRLDSIDFTWETKRKVRKSDAATNETVKFYAMYDHLASFRATYGHTKVNKMEKEWKTRGGASAPPPALRVYRRLPLFLAFVRREQLLYAQGRPSSLDGEKVRRLDELGVVWRRPASEPRKSTGGEASRKKRRRRAEEDPPPPPPDDDGGRRQLEGVDEHHPRRREEEGGERSSPQDEDDLLVDGHHHEGIEVVEVDDVVEEHRSDRHDGDIMLVYSPSGVQMLASPSDMDERQYMPFDFSLVV